MTNETTGGDDPQRHKSTDTTTDTAATGKSHANPDLTTLFEVHGPATVATTRGNQPQIHFDGDCTGVDQARSSREISHAGAVPLRAGVCQRCDPRDEQVATDGGGA